MQLGPYRLQSLLGRGGMGEVYEAHDTVKDRTVALKLMSEQYDSDTVFRQRMQREAQTAGRLKAAHSARSTTTGKSKDGCTSACG